jgi:hypothetical protein
LLKYREFLHSFLIDTDKTDPESLHLLIEGNSHRNAFSQKPVDFNTIPIFQEKEASMGVSLYAALWDFLALILMNFVLFMATYVFFLRADVR